MFLRNVWVVCQRTEVFSYECGYLYSGAATIAQTERFQKRQIAVEHYNPVHIMVVRSHSLMELSPF
jgi:hypothetical protein